eukprot:scaffold109702_cov31-Tisochrysis_lutea.AAC.1
MAIGTKRGTASPRICLATVVESSGTAAMLCWSLGGAFVLTLDAAQRLQDGSRDPILRLGVKCQWLKTGVLCENIPGTCCAWWRGDVAIACADVVQRNTHVDRCSKVTGHTVTCVLRAR